MTTRTISRTLPGVGISNAMELRDGHHLTVVTRHDGDHELTIGSSSAVLDEDESTALANLVGAPKVVSRLAAAQHDIDGLFTEQLPVPMHSPYAGDPLSTTRLRGRTGASVVAVLRDDSAHPMPKPEFVLMAGDLVVTVGTREALDNAARILDGTG